jgi:hypothetical protein
VERIALLSPVQASAPDFCRRFGLILTTLMAVIARRFPREPRLAPLAIPLWTRLTRAIRRFERLMARFVQGTPAKPHRSGPSGPHRATPVLPRGRAWLVLALAHEGAACATQLEALLADPAAVALLAAVPAAQRILHPLMRLLGIGPFAPRRRPAPPPSEPPTFGKLAFRSHGYSWYEVPTPPGNPA